MVESARSKSAAVHYSVKVAVANSYFWGHCGKSVTLSIVTNFKVQSL